MCVGCVTLCRLSLLPVYNSSVSTEGVSDHPRIANVTYASGRECRHKNNHHKELWLYPSYLKRFNHIYIALHKKNSGARNEEIIFMFVSNAV